MPEGWGVFEFDILFVVIARYDVTLGVVLQCACVLNLIAADTKCNGVKRIAGLNIKKSITTAFQIK